MAERETIYVTLTPSCELMFVMPSGCIKWMGFRDGLRFAIDALKRGVKVEVQK